MLQLTQASHMAFQAGSVGLMASSLLGLKALLDICHAGAGLPRWFRVGFAAGTMALLIAVWSVWWAAGGVEGGGPDSTPPHGRALIWTLLLASFLCTASMHGFFPFRFDLAVAWERWPRLRWNMAQALIGLLLVVAGAILFERGLVEDAILVLGATALLLLVPSDTCRNPFNRVWLQWIGASPLMYLPNVLAIALAMAGLRGQLGASVALMMGICLSTLALGYSHRLRLTW